VKTVLLLMLVFSNPQPAVTFNEGQLAVVCKFPHITGVTICVRFDPNDGMRCWYSWENGLIECEPGV